MAFGITNTDNVLSSAFAQLSNARSVEFVEIGANGFVYVGGAAALISFSVDQTDGSLDHIETIDDNATLHLNGSGGFGTAVIGGTTYLFHAAFSDTGVSAFSVNAATGALINTGNFSDDGLGGTIALHGANSVAAAEIGGNTYLFVTSENDDGLTVLAVTSLGALSHVESIFDAGALKLDYARDVATAVVGSTTYVFTGANFDGISVFSADNSGHLTNVFNHAGGGANNYANGEVETVSVGGNTYLISTGYNADGLSVFSVDTNGQLANVFNVTDDTSIALAGANWLKTKVLGGVTYLFVAASGDTNDGGGHYGAVSVWTVGSDGSLTNVANVYDNDTTQMALINSLGVGLDDGTPYLITQAGFSDLGISAFELTPPSPPDATNLTQTKAYDEDDGSVALDDIVVTDPDVGETITATLTLSNIAAGVLTTSGTATYTPGTGIWTITGTVTEVNTALAAVSFTPAANYDVDATITTHIQDAANTGPANGLITLDVTPANDAPGASDLTQTKTYTEGDASVALDNIVVSEVDTDPAQSITATLTLSGIAAGVLTTSGTATYTPGTGIWTITGTVAEVNAALAAVAFTPATDNDVDTTITTHIQDQSAAGPADGLITLDVTPVNDAPAATNLTNTKTYTEGDASVALDDIVVGEVDTDPTQSITAVLTLSNTAAGVLTTSGTATYTSGTGVWTITGTVAQVNAALALVAFTPATDNDVDTTIATQIRDQDNTGPVNGAITLDVTPVNDAPAASDLTQTKAYTEGAASVALDDIVVSEVDTSPAQSITATLTLSNTAAGVLTTSGTASYTAGTGVWTITGTVAQVNAALAAVAFTPATNNDIDATIATQIRDQDNAGPVNGAITLDVTPVNDAPAASNLTNTKAYTEGAASVALDDIVVSEVDTDPAQSITATLTLSNTAAGVLTTSGTATYTAGTGVWTITGTVAEVNAALAAVAFTPATNNDVDATIATHIQDQDAAGPADGVITLDVTPVNDAPAATNLTNTKTYTEGDASVALDDIVVSEVDTDPAQSITATLTLSNTAAGVLTTSGTASYTSGTGIWTITDTVANVNAALAAVAFTPATNNDVDATIATQIRDQDNAGPANGTITLDVTPVDDAPAASNLTQTKAYTEGAASVALDDIVVTDPDTGDAITATLTLSNTAAGVLTTSGTAAYTAGTGVWTITGTVAQVNAALAAVAFTPATNNDVDATISTHVQDAAVTGPADGVITLDVTPVNDAPAATNLTNTKTYTEGAASVALDDIVVSEVDTDSAQTITATLTLSNTAAGALTTSGTATYTPGTGIWTITGTVASVNAALAAVAFTPVTNNDVDATIATHIEDQNAAGPVNGLITLDVTPVNDAPAASNLTQTRPYTEGDASVALNDIVVSEVDTDPTQSITATLTLSNTAAGVLTTSGAATYTPGTGIWTVTGTAAQVNAALAAVAFTPATNNDADATITTHIEDQNAAGPANGAITLDVTPVNDAPVAQDGSASGAENAVINGTLVATDIDSLSLTYSRVTQAAHGSVTVNPDGTFSYTPDADYDGPDSFTFKANDGSVDSNNATVDLTVSAALTRAAPFDFNGDGKADILWQKSDGTPAVWLLDGVNVLATGPALPNPNAGYPVPSGANAQAAPWREVSSADFNGDGKADILWQKSDGTPAVWLMDGVDVLSAGPALSNPGVNWRAMEAADFNADGKADILWQNDNGTPAVWLMDGVDVLSTGPALSNPGPNWREAAAADFNADGKADILWQNADGTPAVWLMDGVDVLSTGPALPNPGASWHALAAADFNGDGKADILWQNADGTPAVWLIDGVDVLAMGPALTNPGPTWHAKEAVDTNGDGKADILWQNDSGTPGVWLMDGTSVLVTGGALSNPGAAWHIV